MDRLSVEQKNKVALMIQKHSQAMLMMIAERLMSLEERSSSDSDDKTSPVCDLSRPPPISPPEFRRSQLFKSPAEFEEVDNHVFQVVQKEYSAFTDLVKDLIVGCETDLEKARAIFRWITCKDLNKLDVCETVNPESPLGLLRGIKYGTETYHDLFKRLCSFAGLYCEVIQGYSKGAGYKPGLKMDGERFRNSWTAVSIDGSWCFVNSNWGARHVKGNNSADKENKNQFFYECDEFYFITNPEDHIYQHFPDDSRWQLLECPISLSEFISLPVVKSSFFNYGLKFTMHYECKQYSKNGLIVIQLRIPNILGFGYTLDPKDKGIEPSALEGRVMLCIIGHKAIFTVAPPKPGKYSFTIFAKDNWCSESLQSACAFELKCRERREKIKSPYPKVSFFGPTPSMSLYGLIPQTHIDPVMVYSHDDIVIQFELHQDVKLSHSLCYHGREKTDYDFQRYVFIKQRDFDSVCYQIRCPTMGKFVFSLFGARVTSPNDNNSPLECLFRYLIECRNVTKDKRPLPRACHRWCGADLLEPKYGDVGLEQAATFRVRVPAASDVAMLIGDAWFHFRELADSIWEGTVLTGKKPCIAKLYGKLNKETSRFSPLLEFQVK
ncbi:hillarin [Patella vulgata]|uniref:hillarin n=1 Tax=Patella vulgata TaxID=6465 RepID=UPI002180362C|nr:hillarin [Patella vulgata]